METAKQKLLFESGNELAAYAAKQINYHVMGYYPITPSIFVKKIRYKTSKIKSFRPVPF